jgi:UDP-glucose 4-epimerase
MFNVYGPGQDMNNLRQGMVSIYLAQAIKSGLIEVKGNLNRFRDFIYIDDVVEAWFRSTLYSSALNQVLNVGTGKRTSVGVLLEKVRICVPGSEFFIQGSTPGDQTGIYADVSLLKKTLNIDKFKELDEGLPIFTSWAFENIRSSK